MSAEDWMALPDSSRFVLRLGRSEAGAGWWVEAVMLHVVLFSYQGPVA
jgi:hypothetical protein